MGLEQTAIFAFAGPSIKIAARRSRHLQRDHFMSRSIENSAQKQERDSHSKLSILIEQTFLDNEAQIKKQVRGQPTKGMLLADKGNLARDLH
jgi:hypothetical protein